MIKSLIIRKSDSKSVRLNKKRLRKRLKRIGKLRSFQKNKENRPRSNISEIDILLAKNFRIKNKQNIVRKQYKIDKDSFSFYDCAETVIDVVLNMVQASNNGNFSLDFNNAKIGFGALYFIDIMGWYKSRQGGWRLDFNNLSQANTEMFLNLRTDKDGSRDNQHSYVVNKHIKIERREDQILFTKEYEKGSKEIRDLVQRGISEKEDNPNFKLGRETHEAIHSAISEQFDNIYQHAKETQHGDLCGMFDKTTNTVSILIFNFGPTISETLKHDTLPKHVKKYRDDVINNYKNRGFFGLKQSFNKDNALTLLALQEGISSKLDADETRGYGLMDFIEHCFELSDQTRVVIISGTTTIRIDSSYKIERKEVLGRIRRVLSFNKNGDVLDKPDNKYVLDHHYNFPGVIIETTIPLK